MNNIKNIFIIIIFLSLMQGCSLNKPSDYVEVWKVKGDTATIEKKIEDEKLVKEYDNFFEKITKKKKIEKNINSSYKIIHVYEKKSLAKHEIEIDNSKRFVKAKNNVYVLTDSEYNDLIKLLKIKS